MKTPNREEQKAIEEKLCQAVDRMREELESLALFLHNNPELSEHEYKGSAYVAQILDDYGFAVEKPIAGLDDLPTAIRAKSSGGPVSIAFLGEYDALPELGHACGHNLIATMSVGAALATKEVVSEYLSTTFLGCPAEETIGGKVYMSEAGLFQGYDGALIIHPGNCTEVGGSSLASHPLEVTFYGKEAHIAQQEEGINALDCAVLYYSAAKEFVANCDQYALIGIMITDGGVAPNIVPSQSTLRMTVRAKKVDYLENHVLPNLKELAHRVAQQKKAQVTMRHYEPLFKDLQQDSLLDDIFFNVFTEMGEQPVRLPPDATGGSTDVGNVSYDVPTSHPTLYIYTGAIAHTEEFAQAAASEKGIDQAIKGAKAMAITAFRYALQRL